MRIRKFDVPPIGPDIEWYPKQTFIVIAKWEKHRVSELWLQYSFLLYGSFSYGSTALHILIKASRKASSFH